jgi:hypothetical protein
LLHLRTQSFRSLDAGRRTAHDCAQLAARPSPGEIWQVVRTQMVLNDERAQRGLTDNTREAMCIKRLMRDLKECMLDPLPTVVGRPVFENDIR